MSGRIMTHNTVNALAGMQKWLTDILAGENGYKAINNSAALANINVAIGALSNAIIEIQRENQS